MIRRATLAACLAVLASSAGAQTVEPAPFQMPKADETAPTSPNSGDRFQLPSRDPSGEANPIDEFLNELLGRAQPHLEGLARDVGGLMDEYAPVFEELSKLMDDIENYQLPPERLPNGDILIRRKADAPPPPPLEELPNFLPKGSTIPAPGKPVVTPPNGSQVDL